MATPAVGSALFPLIPVLPGVAAVRGLRPASVEAGVTCVAGGHPARPCKALDLPHLSLFAHFRVSFCLCLPDQHTYCLRKSEPGV